MAPVECHFQDPQFTCSCTHPRSFSYLHVLPSTGSDSIHANPKQLPRKRQTRRNNQTTRPRKIVKRGDKTPKNNYTKRAPKGRRLSPLGGCPVPGPKKWEWLFTKYKLESWPSRYFPGRSCRPVRLNNKGIVPNLFQVNTKASGLSIQVS